MKIIGIDPGTATIGFAALEYGTKPALCEAGLLAVTSAGQPERLAEIYRSLAGIISRFKPDAIAVEKLFFARNAKTAMAVAEARGAILLTAALERVSVYEYAPAEIKNAVAGHGGADKKAVEKMILLTLPETRGMRARDDVFDAIAAALTCGLREFRTPFIHISQGRD